MTISQSPAAVISDLPEWQGATWTELQGGLTNRTWLLEKGGNKAVLKIDDQPREAPYNSRLEEAAVQSAAAGAGLAADVLFAGDLVYLTAYVEGTVLDSASLMEDSNLEHIAAALRRLHSLPFSGRAFDPVFAANRYVQSIDNPDTQLVAVCVDIISNTRLSKNLRCCHNDLVAENIVATPDLKFLDWEYACDNDPLFDLATIAEHHELDEQQTCTLLDAYCVGRGEHRRANLAKQQRLYLALLWLWLASQPGHSYQDLQRVTARLTTSCS